MILVYLYALRHVFLLFPSENMLVEEVLDLFVGDVDAQLLKGVLLEVLKAEDVQQPHSYTLPTV